MKVCTVLKDILAKIPKMIQRKEEKGHFGLILILLGKIGGTVISKILKLKVALVD